MSEFVPAPYMIAPQLDQDAKPPACCDHLLTLRRYHVVAALEGDDFPAYFTLTRSFATYAAAEVRLSKELQEYPNARVTSFFLAFDPDDADQLAAFVRLSEESETEQRELHQ